MRCSYNIDRSNRKEVCSSVISPALQLPQAASLVPPSQGDGVQCFIASIGKMFYSVKLSVVKVCILRECVLFWLFGINIEQIRSVLVCENE